MRKTVPNTLICQKEKTIFFLKILTLEKKMFFFQNYFSEVPNICPGMETSRYTQKTCFRLIWRSGKSPKWD